jgi:hypothetical protein
MGSDILERYLLTAYRKMVCDNLLHVNRVLVEEECICLFPPVVYTHRYSKVSKVVTAVQCTVSADFREVA